MSNDWQDKFLNVTWDEFRSLAFELSNQISHSQHKFTLIVAIARGGLTIAQLLSDSLKLPIAAFTVESYKNLKQEKLPHITHGLSSKLAKYKILLVDDICDTGKTFLRGLAYLEELGATRADITTCSLHYKPHAEYKPDYYVGTTSAWVVYPYEVRETIAQLVPFWKKEEVSQQEMKKRFISFGFPKDEVEYFLKHY